MGSSDVQKRGNFVSIFITGAKKGIQIALNIVLPSILFGYFIAQILQLSGIMNVIGTVLQPVMGIFGLPGEAALPFVLGPISFGGSVSTAVMLCAEGLMSGTQAAIMIPYIYLTGSIPSFMGRVLDVAGVKEEYKKVIILIGFIMAILSLFVTRLVLSVIV